MDRQQRDSLVLPSLGRGLVAVGPLVVPGPAVAEVDADLPARRRFLFRVAGIDRTISVTVRVGFSPPAKGDWVVFRTAGLHVALKLEA